MSYQLSYTLNASNFQKGRGLTTIMAYEDKTNNQVVVSTTNVSTPLGLDIVLTTLNSLKYRFSIPYIPDNLPSPVSETEVYTIIQSTNDPIFSGGTVRATRLEADDNYLVFTLFSKD